MAALVAFCSDLHDLNQGEHSQSHYWGYSLESNIGADSLTLVISHGLAKGGITRRNCLQLRVEKDLVSCDPILKSQGCDQEEPCLEVADRDSGCTVAKVKLPYARTSLVDIHLGREGDYYYLLLLVIDGNQLVESPQPVPVRFQLGVQGCYQLSDSSHSPPVLPVEQFLNPPPVKPKLLTSDVNSGAVLPWPASLGILMLTSALVGWICAVSGQSREGPGASMATLMFLLGTVPFFVRRVGGYTLTGLLIVAAAGVLVSLAGFLFKANIVVIPCLLMGGLLSQVFCTNAYGKAKAGLIDLEKNQPHRTKFLATRTEQEQNMLWIGDFAIVLAVTVLLVWAYSSIRAWIN